VAAHAHSADGIETAIRAGVDSIEHASLIDDEGTRLAKEKGTVMVVYMVAYGMSPLEAIRPATIHAAELLGWTDDVGVIGFIDTGHGVAKVQTRTQETTAR